MNFMYSSVISSYSLVMVGTGKDLEKVIEMAAEIRTAALTPATIAGVWLFPIFRIQARGILNSNLY